jgi:transposase-like protein
VGDQLSLSLAPVTKRVYQPRGINALQRLLKEHFQSFADQYEAKHAIIYGRFRIERITEVVEKFVLCGDYSQGVARIQCTNPDCKYEYFRPFSCKSFYFCPSCSQKRTLLFSQYMNQRLLLALPHRQFVFTFPKLLRPYFRHNRRLFSEISRLIFAILQRFYDKAAKRPVRTGMVLAYQTSGEFLRWNPHFHCLVLEGGFDDRGKFVHIPLGEIQRMSEYFRRVVIKSFLKKELINAHLATSLINWKHSGFSVDHSIRIPAFSIRAREALSQYIARPPLSLKKIGIEENGEATAVCFTSQSEFFKGKTETFPVIRFFLELTQHIPPKGCQYIRRYGLYASRTKGTWPDKPHVVRLAPAGWKEQQQQAVQADQDVQLYDAEAADSVSDNQSRSTWARLIAQVYEVDPLVCPRCSAAMRILAVISEPQEVRKILRHLMKIGRSPPGFEPASLN